MNVSEPPSEHWELATQWRDGGTPISMRGISSEGSASHGEGEGGAVVSLGLLRSCFSERYGSHIPRMFHDLLLDLGRAFAVSADEARAAAPPDQGKGAEAGPGDGSARTPRSPVTFHVTEYDVIKGKYPPSWEDHAGYIIPGGVASAAGKEPWMTTLLGEVKGLRESGRPVLAFCLGHQVVAQALGGLVQPAVGSDRHYALQESELLLPPAECSSSSSYAPLDVVRDAVVAVRRRNGGHGDGNGGDDGGREGKELSPSVSPPPPAPPLRLLYHHNDEVVELPPGATNFATSRRCKVHGMMMMPGSSTPAPTPSPTTAEAAAAAASILTSSSEIKGAPAPGDPDPPAPSVLTFQAHPELNYEYGRGVMNGMLDADVDHGRLTQEEGSKLKEQVLAWDHKEFPVAIELMRRLFAPIVPRSHGSA